MHRAFAAILAISLLTIGLLSCASAPDTLSAEESYALGQAYYDLKKYAEAEPWLLRAVNYPKTKNAALYQLGRVYAELKRYEEAAKYFEQLLQQDPENTQVLRAAAFTLLSAGEDEKAFELYARLSQIVPQSSVERYNYALLLYKAERYEEVLEITTELLLEKEDDKDSLLLQARSQKALQMPEAVDAYSKWLASTSEVSVQKELADFCVDLELYAKAVELYDTILKNSQVSRSATVKAQIRFTKARALALAGDVSASKELDTAVEDGFEDEVAIKSVQELISKIPVEDEEEEEDEEELQE